MIIEKYGISLRLVEQEDAAFIVKLRTDDRLSRFLSATSPDIETQKEWIKSYKMREEQGAEFYFVASYQGVDYGTVRIYNIEDDFFEWGSWLFVHNTPDGVAVLSEIVAREFAFERTGASHYKVEVRKGNKTVVQYHRGYKPTLLRETEFDYFFYADKASFEKHKSMLVRLFNKTNK